MEQEQKKESSKKKWIIIIILLLLILIIWLVFSMLNEKDPQNTNQSAQDNEQDFSEQITMAQPIEHLISDAADGAGSWAIADDTGYIYYGQTTVEKQAVMVRDTATGEDVERWSVGAGESEHLEVIGLNDSSVLFVFPDIEQPTCTQLWDEDLTYYGVSQGTDNYSGAAGLLLENDSDFLQQMRDKCKA